MAVGGRIGIRKEYASKPDRRLDTPTAGKVYIDGRDIFAMKEAQSDDFPPPEYRLYLPELSPDPGADGGAEHHFPGAFGLPQAGTEIPEELLAVLGLSDRRRHLPGQLSGGQQQRVAIGRALITRPALILADEPTGNLDTRNTSEVIALLKEASHLYEQTIVMITHSQRIAQAADRILRVSDGVGDGFRQVQGELRRESLRREKDACGAEC